MNKSKDDSLVFRTSISTLSLISPCISDKLDEVKVDDFLSFNTNYDFDCDLSKEALWNEHYIHTTEKTRILWILEDFLNVICIALSLDELMQNKKFLSSKLTQDEYITLFNNFENYWKEEEIPPHSVIFSQHETKASTDLYEWISILSKRKEICDRAGLIVRSRINHCSIYNAFAGLTSFFIKILNTQIQTEIKHNLFLMDVWNKNERAKKKVQEIKMLLKRKKIANSKLIREKLNYFQSHTNVANSLKHACVEQIKHDENSVERRMINEINESKEVCKKLQEESKRIQNECETLVAKHLQKEKLEKKRNLKIETQLFEWIQKYDLEMVERQNRYDELHRTYQDEKFLHDEILVRLKEQQPIYEILMIEKHEYLEKLWNEKYQNFIQNFAAKRIQRYYRQHRKYVVKSRKAARAAAARSYASWKRQTKQRGLSTKSFIPELSRPSKASKSRKPSQPTKSSKK